MPGDYGQGGIEKPGLPRCPGRGSAARFSLRLVSLAALVALAGTAAAVSVGAGSGGPGCARPKLDAAYSERGQRHPRRAPGRLGQRAASLPRRAHICGGPSPVPPSADARWAAGRAPPQPADRLRRLLPPLRHPERAERRRHGAAARRRRKPDRLAAGERVAALSSTSARAGTSATGRASPGSRSRICAAATCRSCGRATSTLDGVRYRQESFATRLPRVTRARQLHPAARRSAPLGRAEGIRPLHAVGRLPARHAGASPVQPGREAASLVARLRHERKEPAHRLRGLGRPSFAAEAVPAEQRDLQAREALGERLLGSVRVAAGATFRVPERAGHERRAESRHPEPAHVVADTASATRTSAFPGS